MPKFKKAEILTELDKTIAKEAEEFLKQAKTSPEKKAAYEEERKKWVASLQEWKKTAVIKFKEAIDSVTPEMIEKDSYTRDRLFGGFCPPWAPTKPQTIDASLAGQSSKCSHAERARVRITLMLEDKNGGITLSDNDEIFYSVLIPCR